MTPATVLVTNRSFGTGDADPQELLEAHGLQVVRADPDHSLEHLAEPPADAVAWIAGVGPISGQHLDLAPNLRLVARYGTGVDAVDLGACAARGVTVTNTPGANAGAVAEHTPMLILASLRRLLEGDAAVRSGAWKSARGRELGSLHIGVVGFGRIGRRVAELARCCGAAVSAHDPYLSSASIRAAGVTPLPLSELVGVVDILTLHRPGGNAPLVDRAVLSQLRPGVVLVNTARRDLVDEAAVAAALRSGNLGGYASDVTRLEVDDELVTAPHTIFTPHVGAQTTEAIDRMGMTAAEEVLRVAVHNDRPKHPVAVAAGKGGVHL